MGNQCNESNHHLLGRHFASRAGGPIVRAKLVAFPLGNEAPTLGDPHRSGHCLALVLLLLQLEVSSFIYSILSVLLRRLDIRSPRWVEQDLTQP